MKKFELKGLPKDLLLIVFGAVIGAFGDQIFFKSNKEFELKAELNRNLFYDQYQFLNRLMDFSTMYCSDHIQTREERRKGVAYWEVRGDTLSKSREDSLNKLQIALSRDPRLSSVYPGDTTKTLPPSFITSPNKRKQFLEDIDFIRTNKGKIDTKLYAIFEDLLTMIDRHPLPQTFDPKEILKSSWCDKNLLNKWRAKMNDLYLWSCDLHYREGYIK